MYDMAVSDLNENKSIAHCAKESIKFSHSVGSQKKISEIIYFIFYCQIVNAALVHIENNCTGVLNRHEQEVNLRNHKSDNVWIKSNKDFCIEFLISAK